MREGWNSDDYLILFEPEEIPKVSVRHGIAELLPGYEILGLRGWDDFILRASNDSIFTVPTVPIDPKHLAPYQLPCPKTTLKPDERFQGRIKWYTKPIVFGGDASRSDNLSWIDHGQHVELVRFWNKTYRSLKFRER